MTADLPATMNAVEIKAFGPPEMLVPTTRPVPVPGEGEVLIRVAAAGVNRPDISQRIGNYPPPPGVSDLPGLEIAGTVVARGPGGTGRFKIGDRLCALVAGGGYAGYCIAPEPQCLPVPKGFSLAEAAALPETFFTVWANVFERGRLQPGESILIHGGSSGIGTVAIQLAHAFGATVYATAGTADKCLACEKLGARRAIDYRTEDFVEVVKSATGERGVDVVLDMVGGDYIPRNLKVLAREGRLVFIAFLGGAKAEVNFLPVLRNHLTITGSTLRPRPVAEKGRLAAALEAKVWPLLDAGTIRPIIHRSFPLAEAAEAHRLMESSGHIGKIILLND